MATDVAEFEDQKPTLKDKINALRQRLRCQIKAVPDKPPKESIEHTEMTDTQFLLSLDLNTQEAAALKRYALDVRKGNGDQPLSREQIQSFVDDFRERIGEGEDRVVEQLIDQNKRISLISSDI